VVVVASIAAIAAVFVMLAFIRYHAAQQWPLLSPHINRESLVQRIDDLKHNKSLERTREG
jgi:hypothetical protein